MKKYEYIILRRINNGIDLIDQLGESHRISGGVFKNSEPPFMKKMNELGGKGVENS